MITISFLPFCCHYFTPNAITCLIFTPNCCRSASRRRKRPHGALAGLKALLAARKEKQKVKEDASGTGSLVKEETIGSVDKEAETDLTYRLSAISGCRVTDSQTLTQDDRLTHRDIDQVDQMDVEPKH